MFKLKQKKPQTRLIVSRVAIVKHRSITFRNLDDLKSSQTMLKVAAVVLIDFRELKFLICLVL